METILKSAIFEMHSDFKILNNFCILNIFFFQKPYGWTKSTPVDRTVHKLFKIHKLAFMLVIFHENKLFDVYTHAV